MLIRSQDKEMIVNVDAIKCIRVGEKSQYDVCADGMILGYYSTKTKAMKVLDMIQEAYCKFMSVKNDDAWDGKESVFCMPEDSEVEE